MTQNFYLVLIGGANNIKDDNEKMSIGVQDAEQTQQALDLSAISGMQALRLKYVPRSHLRIGGGKLNRGDEIAVRQGRIDDI